MENATMIPRMDIRPELYQWACNRTPVDPEKLRQRFPMFDDWVSGKKRPTLKQLEQFAKIFGKIERARLLDKECHKETIAEIRWTKEEEKTKGNGILVDSFDLTHSERTSLDFLKRGDALQLISKWDLGQNIVNMFKKTINTSSAIGIICTKGDDYKDFFDTGRLLERVWLEATSYDLAFQPVSPVTLLYFSQKKGADKHLNQNTIHEIKTQYKLLSSLLNLSEEDQPFFVFRLAKTNKKTPFSIRKKTPLNTLN